MWCQIAKVTLLSFGSRAARLELGQRQSRRYGLHSVVPVALSALCFYQLFSLSYTTTHSHSHACQRLANEIDIFYNTEGSKAPSLDSGVKVERNQSPSLRLCEAVTPAACWRSVFGTASTVEMLESL